MKRSNLVYVFAILSFIAAGMPEKAYAGGALFSGENGKPIRWARREVKGGALGSNTVDAQQRVLYRVDSGPLGPFTNPEAVKLVDRIFKLYTDIPTASIEFVNGGSIIDPRTRTAVDVDGKNVGSILSSRNPTFQNPIIFDSDGSISGGGGVLGFFGNLNINEGDEFSDAELLEGFVVLNGRTVTLAGGRVPFLGVFTHEFGHFAGPLDHSQIFGRIVSEQSDFSSANPLTGFDNAQIFDVFGPFIETVYPFLFDGPLGSKLSSNGFGSSGSFIATLSFDDEAALSAIYPMPGYLPTEPGSIFGGISGRVFIRTSDRDFPLSGVNVVARRISRGKYPPDPKTDVYSGGKPQVDPDGVPIIPADRDELDPLRTATSIVTGNLDGSGDFNFVGLPPGDYLLSIEEIGPSSLRGSGIGPRASLQQLSILTPENYNGPNESNDPKIDNPREFTAVKVVAGQVATGIDFVINGIGLSTMPVDEKEPNDKAKKAQTVNLNSTISGEFRPGDAFKSSIDFESIGSENDGLEDLYQFSVSAPTTVTIALKAADPSADIDVYLLQAGFKKLIPFRRPPIVDLSISPSGLELIGPLAIPAGNYVLGISGFDKGTKYTLSVFRQ